MGIDKGKITASIHYARTMDIRYIWSVVTYPILKLAYSMVYNMGIDKGQITASIHYARTMDIR